MSHTPGPWHMDEDTPRDICDLEGTMLATAYRIGGDQKDWERNGRANARLIACAPELLEALKHAKQFIQNGIEFGYIRLPEMLQDTAHETLPLIQQAIAKAEGKPSIDPDAL